MIWDRACTWDWGLWLGLVNSLQCAFLIWLGYDLSEYDLSSYLFSRGLSSAPVSGCWGTLGINWFWSPAEAGGAQCSVSCSVVSVSAAQREGSDGHSQEKSEKWYSGIFCILAAYRIRHFGYVLCNVQCIDVFESFLSLTSPIPSLPPYSHDLITTWNFPAPIRMILLHSSMEWRVKLILNETNLRLTSLFRYITRY